MGVARFFKGVGMDLDGNKYFAAVIMVMLGHGSTQSGLLPA